MRQQYLATCHRKLLVLFVFSKKLVCLAYGVDICVMIPLYCSEHVVPAASKQVQQTLENCYAVQALLPHFSHAVLVARALRMLRSAHAFELFKFAPHT